MTHPSIETPFALGTFSAAGSPRFAGLVVADQVVAVAALAHLAELRGAHSVLGLLEHWEHNFAQLDRLARQLAADKQGLPFLGLDQVHYHAPVDLPRQIFCSGANYHKHVVDLIVDDPQFETDGMDNTQRRAYAVELMNKRAREGKPFVFNKVASSVTGPFDPIVIPAGSKKPDWELELGVVIGKPARRVSRENALDHVAGYVVVNDLTERTKVFRPDIPQMGMDWLSSKNAPTFLPMGPYLVPAAYVGNPQELQLTLRLNGQVMQDESTADMIFDVARIIEFISQSVQLLPGDLICSGSPSGNGTHYNRFLQAGDLMEGTIAKLGTQRNPCVDER